MFAHTPGRGHNRKSLPAKKRRFQKRAKKKRVDKEAKRKAAEEVWNGMSEEARKMRPDLNPDNMKF
jgi:hypothetical protein